MPAKKKTPAKKKSTKPINYIVKPKIPKDPKAPKGALTAFMIYSTEQRPKLSPKISFGESGKKLGEQWRAMTDTKRKKYEKAADADKERYKKEMSKYKPSAKMAKMIDDAKAKPAKIKADPNAPKRGRTSYIVFSDLHRPAIAKKNPGMKMTDLSVELGKLWKKVKPTEKSKCEAIAAKEKAVYEKALLKYKPAADYQAALDKLAGMKKKASGGDKAEKDKQKAKATKAKEKAKKLKETEKKWSGEVKKLSKEVEKLAATKKKLGAAQEKLKDASKALAAFNKEAGITAPKKKAAGKKAPPKIAEAVAVDGPKKSIKKKTPKSGKKKK